MTAASEAVILAYLLDLRDLLAFCIPVVSVHTWHGELFDH